MKRPGVIARTAKRRRSPEERELSLAWKVMVGGVCEVCPFEAGSTCSGPIHGHHIVSQQALRRRGLAFPENLWHLHNKLDVCEKRHDLHTRAIKRIPLVLLPAVSLAFARAHDLEWWLERFYD